MNLFKDLPAGKNVPEEINVVIEIPARTQNKIEYDEELGYFKFDRVLHSPMFYPLNYGFVPQTHSGDGDSLDVLVLSSTPIPCGVVVKCRPVGFLVMSDEAGVDNKLIAVPLDKLDPYFKHVKDINDVHEQTRKEIEVFFADYKKLEPGGKYEHVKVQGFKGVEEAKKLIVDAAAAYKNS
ncbi:MAG: inorganic diphosphatase [bacterium]